MKLPQDDARLTQSLLEAIAKMRESIRADVEQSVRHDKSGEVVADTLHRLNGQLDLLRADLETSQRRSE